MEENLAGSASLAVWADVAQRTHFACLLNDVPLLRRLEVRNGTRRGLEDLTLRLSAAPAFLEPRSWRIEHLPPESAVRIEALDVRLDPGVLWALTETTPAEVRLVLEDRHGLEVAVTRHRVELLPRRHWGGSESMPEMLAAFVQPNDPVVDRVLGAAAEHLRRMGMDPALDGYGAHPRLEVWRLAAAVFRACADLGFGYALPPASFEREGQKIRSPSAIAESGVATCLDSTLLAAACLEQAGFHPLVVVEREHAYVGLWLEEGACFDGVVVRDAAAPRKALRLGELVVFETTRLREGPRADFRAACEEAARRLAALDGEEFSFVLDVHGARLRRIRPLPSLEAEAPPRVDAEPAATTPSGAAPVPLDAPDLAPPLPRSEPEPETPRDRIDRWQRRLLDLTLRNRLLHFRETRKSVRLRCCDPGRLEDLLAEGKKVRIVAAPNPEGEDEGRSAELHRRRTGEDLARAFEEEALRRGEVMVDLPPEELDRRLVELYRAARASLQEGGANTLHLALGFLKWRRRGEERDLYAPLLLVPVALERRSARSPVRLALLDDEPRVNPTLLRLLEQDFGVRIPELEGPPPTDEAGLDVAGIWRLVTRAVRDLESFEVTEDVVLSTFSFAKYLMWKDLADRSERLLENRVVRHLVETPREPYPVTGDFPRPETLDRDLDPVQLFAPLRADSSQLAAVTAAARGHDFVLFGPPGTGKSQTIANLIAHALAEGKSVLFVSEKTAALEVVHRRLKEIGIGEFCLELHSHKAKKLDVLDQLRRAWEARAEADEAARSTRARRLLEARDRLNRFVRRLHLQRRNGLTAYEAIGRVAEGRGVPEVALRWEEGSDAHDAEDLAELERVTDEMDALLRALDDPSRHPLRVVRHAEWTPLWQRRLLEAAAAVEEAIRREAEARADFLERTALPVPAARPEVLEALVDLARSLGAVEGEDLSFSLDEEGAHTLDGLDAAVDLLRERQGTLTRLGRLDEPEVLDDLDVAGLRATWNEAEEAFFLRAFFLRRRVRRTLARVLGGRRSDPAADLDLLKRLRRLEREIDALAALRVRAGRLFRGVRSDPDRIARSVAAGRRLRSVLARLGPHLSDEEELRAALRRLLEGASERLAPDAPVGRAAAEFVERSEALREAVAALAEAAAATPEDLFPPAAEDAPAALRGVLAALRERAPQLRDLCEWRRIGEEARRLGLGPLVEAYDEGRVGDAGARRLFDVNYRRWWLQTLLEEDEVLRGFSSPLHERERDVFARLEEELRRLSAEVLRARLCARQPERADVDRSSQWGLLRREFQKKRRHLPVRRLLAAIPDILSKLTPCVLMSPLSIAQYLPPDQSLFDLVVFDEASQIPVWDAVGALARGRRAVVVGDPKQLPPTSFFQRAVDADEEPDPEVDTDLESILDELIGAGLPQLRLRWHYRSRHETLIAFSNRAYYEGELVTFPSPVTEDRAVRLRPVPEGVYEKGSARVNRAEAHAVVAYAVERLSDAEFRRQGLTLGIVTFNLEQQRLVEDLLDEARRRHPELEPHFADDAHEPVFVKNLESVQGDERDVVLFSVTYGPDADGRVSMNFGPLNRQGGERRLNVAVTRARRELVVFATLRPEQIDLERTRARGVRDLKRFLEYAERGPISLAGATETEDARRCRLAESLRAALEERGWSVRAPVGVSRFRLDLGVVHPDDPSRFLAGVELDGETYRAAPSALDREIVREGALAALGWRVVRVWALDLWADPEGTAARVHERLEALLERERAEGGVPTVDGAEEGEAAARWEDVEGAAEGAPGRVAETETPTAPDPTSRERIGVAIDGGPSVPATGGSGPADIEKLEPRPYEEADLSRYESAVDAERFYEPVYDTVLVPIVEAMLRAEGPVLEERVVRRVARLHGFGRTGARIRERVLAVARRLAGDRTSGWEGAFLWPPGRRATEVLAFREPGFDGEPRALEEVPDAELFGLALHVVRTGRRGEAAVRRMAALLGIGKLHEAPRRRLAEWVDRAGG